MTGEITLRELAGLDVEILKGVGEKRKASLHEYGIDNVLELLTTCLLYTSPSPRDRQKSRMPSSA